MYPKLPAGAPRRPMIIRAKNRQARRASGALRADEDLAAPAPAFPRPIDFAEAAAAEARRPRPSMILRQNNGVVSGVERQR